MFAEMAAVFHYPPMPLDEMTIEDVVHWHGRAVEIWNRMNSSGKKPG